MNKFVPAAIAAALLAGAAVANAYTKEDIDKTRNPYANWKPEFPGYTPGMSINKDNVDKFAGMIDPAMAAHIKEGWAELKTTETESLELHPGYWKATEASIGNEPTLNAEGMVENFVAGRPFPLEPSKDDPAAGIKLAWNYQYGYNWGDNAAICPFYWKYRDAKTPEGKIERQLKFCFHFLNWKHRVNQPPVPEFAENPGQLYRSIYLKVYEPFDLSNTQLLIHRYKNDLKRDDAWLYLGFQRRVRRLATGQTTDSFLGADLSIEDFEGYNGRISDYAWTYVETKNILLPYYRHNDLELASDLPAEADGYKYVDFHGHGGCFPKIHWQLRKVYLLKGEPKDPSHPIQRREMNIDAQTFKIGRTSIYDRKGDLWRSFTIGSAHPDYHHPFNKGLGLGIDDSFMQLNVQTQHCTTGQFKGLADPALNPPQMFTVQFLRKEGR